MNKYKIILNVLYSILFLIIISDYAFAHGASIFAWTQGDMVHTQSKFGNGKNLMNMQIQVFDLTGKMLLQGRTDENGKFSFKPIKKIDMKIVFSDKTGHKSEWTVLAKDFKEELTKAIKPSSDIQYIIEKVLNEKLVPIIAQFEKNSNKNQKILNILGGIGYILGLMGIGAYFNYRKQKK